MRHGTGRFPAAPAASRPRLPWQNPRPMPRPSRPPTSPVPRAASPDRQGHVTVLERRMNRRHLMMISFGAVFTTILTVSFAFSGTELIGITAGEAEARAPPSSARSVRRRPARSSSSSARSPSSRRCPWKDAGVEESPFATALSRIRDMDVVAVAAGSARGLGITGRDMGVLPEGRGLVRCGQPLAGSTRASWSDLPQPLSGSQRSAYRRGSR